jgi:hypothetical protein
MSIFVEMLLSCIMSETYRFYSAVWKFHVNSNWLINLHLNHELSLIFTDMSVAVILGCWFTGLLSCKYAGCQSYRRNSNPRSQRAAGTRSFSVVTMYHLPKNYLTLHFTHIVLHWRKFGPRNHLTDLVIKIKYIPGMNRNLNCIIDIIVLEWR